MTALKLYQPALFIGLGGTGCLVGTELERRLRDELCGPDGMAFANRFEHQRHQPFQLPSCLQFVYADFSESQLNRLAYRQAEGPLRAAYSQTARATRSLLPKVDSSPQITQSLRAAFPAARRAWLPPREDEPHIAPLSDGAGQLPTVGRACLFETFRYGLDPAMETLREAIAKIVRSGEDIAALGGDLQARGCDVFVAFSVAGGTGAGIFYDYLHLIAKAFDEAHLRVKIYPLVLMPSAFDEHAGGGRPAELNAARALVDLFRLVDDQNAPAVADELSNDVEPGSSVLYPTGLVRMRPATTQTAFLFSRTAGIEREDLHRSAVSMIMSLIGTGPDRDRHGAGGADDPQSFAENFVNASARRSEHAASGIGRKGVSTALVASMTVPKEQLAELLAGRLLAQGVQLLDDRARRETERYRDHVVRMFGTSGLGPLWSRYPDQIAEVAPAQGAPAILAALAARADDIDDALDSLDRRLTTTVADLARDFNPNAAVPDLLKAGEAQLDPFQLHWVVAGSPDAKDRVAREGFGGMVRSRQREPERPGGVEPARPQPRRIKDRVPKLVPARWADPEVRASLDDQDQWHKWQARVRWHQHWNGQARRWTRHLEAFESDVAELREAFIGFVTGEKETFSQRRRELYQPRAAVSYMLPPQADLKAFYDAAMRRLVQAEDLGDNDDAGDLLRTLVPPELWESVYRASLQQDPQIAVNLVKDHLKFRILDLFATSGGRAERPLLPALGELLVAMANGERGTLDEKTLAGYRNKISGMILPNFEPEGSGALRTLVVYPATKDDPRVREYLQENLLLPRDGTIDFRTAATESISVLMYRSNMGLIDVPEVRKVLRSYADAVKEDRRDDHLMWRQRLGWREDWLAGTVEEQQLILQRLLCAMWNGQIKVAGDEDAPTRIRVALAEDDSAAMILDLDWYDPVVSSWGSVLRAYEAWTLLDSGKVAQDFSARLLETTPSGMESPPRPPSDLFVRFVDSIVPAQQRLLADPRFADEEWVYPLRTFWTTIVDGALDLRLTRKTRAARTTLRRLYESFDEGQPAAAFEEPPAPTRPTPAVAPAPTPAPVIGSPRRQLDDGPGRPRRARATRAVETPPPAADDDDWGDDSADDAWDRDDRFDDDRFDADRFDDDRFGVEANAADVTTDAAGDDF